MTIKVKLLEPIEGYSDIAEYRFPTVEDRWLHQNGNVISECPSGLARLVLTPIPKWRPATLEDAIRAIKGETVKARFKDYEDTNWEEDELTGYDKHDKYPWRSRMLAKKQCEVLDV